MAENLFTCFGSDDEDDSEGEGTVTTEQQHRLVAEANARIQQTELANKHRAASVNRLPLKSKDFEVFDAPESGKGLRALRQYRAGDEILREHAVLRIPNQQAASSLEEAEAMHAASVARAFAALSSETQAAFRELSICEQHTGEATPLGIYQTNSFQLGAGESDGGMFLTIARINHNCRPNSNHSWRPDLQQMLIVASRDIGVGDEISTTYLPTRKCLTTVARREFLRDRFSFECVCEMCLEGTKGDERMKEIGLLQDDILFLMESSNYHEAGPKVEQCLQLLDEQGLGISPFVVPMLHYGYQASSSDASQARSYLTRELAAVKSCEGERSPKVIELARLLYS